LPEVIKDLVSVIIPVHNRAALLREAVDSVLAQTWPHFEIIISDDGSTDETVEFGRALATRHAGVVQYLWNPNRGAGPARESGRQIACGEFIQYLDSDDTLWPRKFEIQIAALRERSECGVAYGQIRLCPEDAAPLDKPHKWSGRALPTLFPWLLVDRWWNTNAPLWRRSVCDAIGPWSDLRYSQDWEYDARAGALGVRLVHCPEFVTDQRHHDENRQTGSGAWLAPPDRVLFFKSLFTHAQRAGVASDTAEMKHFARWVFSQARACAELGESNVARELCALVKQAQGRDSLELRAYRGLSGLFGWQRTAHLAERVRVWRGNRSGSDTQKQSWMT
jgi:glycosyltransferase involved in cell wall biosynthesis